MAPRTPRKTSRSTLDEASPAPTPGPEPNSATTGVGMRDSLRKRTASASTSKANSSEDLFSDVQLSRNSMAAMNAVAYAPEEEEQSRSSGRKSLVAVVTVMFTLVLAMSTTSQWMAPHQLPLLRYHQKRAPLPVVNSGTMVYAIDSGRIYNFDFRAGNPTFAIDINPTKLNPCQSVQIQIADGGCSGDTYSVLLDGIELGKTSPAKSLTCTLTTANGTVIDMTDPSRQTTMLFPGVLWDTKWSSGRFNIPPGQHVIEIQSVTKGDGTGGTLVMSTLEHVCTVSPNSKDANNTANALYRGIMAADRTQHVFYPNGNTEWVAEVPNNGSCVEITVIDSVCGGDRWNLEIDGAPYGNSSVVDPIQNCTYPNLNEGEGTIEWFDLVRPPVPNDLHSKLKFRLTVPGNHTMRFYPLWGPGSDGRWAYYWISYYTCAGSTMGPATAWTETASKAMTTSYSYSEGYKFVTATKMPAQTTAAAPMTTSATAAASTATSVVPATSSSKVAAPTTSEKPSSAGRTAVVGALAGVLGMLGMAL